MLPTGRDAAAMLVESCQAYVLYGIEPGLDFADTATARQALHGAKVVAFSHFACASTRDVADVILPIGLLPEIDGTLTNLDGRTQAVKPGGKLPLEAREGWRVLRALGGELGLSGFDFLDLAGLRAQLRSHPVVPSTSAQPIAAQEGLEVAATPAIYHADAVVPMLLHCRRIR